MRLIRSKQHGDTLIEVLFAITILTAVLAGSFAIANKATTTSRLNYERTQAVKYAESQVEIIKSISAGMSKPEFFNNYKNGTFTGAQCLTEDNQVKPTTDTACKRIGLYTISLKYVAGTNEESGYFLSRVEWDADANGNNPKNVEMVYRVYGEEGQTGLYAAKAAVAGLIQSTYTNTSWSALLASINLPESTSTQVVAKTIAINAAIQGLVHSSNISSYTNTLAAVQQSDYTAASWAAYMAVVNANVVSGDNTQAQVNTATQNISNAQANLQRPVSPMPTIAHVSVGTFTITNYNASNTYTLSQTSGSSSRSGSTVTCATANGTCSITATVSGGSASHAANYARTQYTYSTYWYQVAITDYWQLESGDGSGGWDNGTNWRSCTGYGDGTMGCAYGHYAWAQGSVKNAPPAGYTDSGADWYRIF